MAHFDLVVLYEHPECFKPLFAALDCGSVAWRAIDAVGHSFDPAQTAPPAPLVFNRIAMSSFLRQAEHPIYYAQSLFAHWEGLGARVLNGSAALALDASKARQLALIHRLGLAVPVTRVVHARADLVAAAETAGFPLVVKADVGGAGAAPAADLPIIAAAVGGCRLRIPAILRSRPDSFGIVMPARSRLRSVTDLAGRTVIVSSARGSITHYLLLEALREVGLKPDAVTIGFMLPGDAASAYDAGKFDAWVTFGVYLARAELAGGRVLRDARGICPGYSGIAVAQSAFDDPARHRALGDILRRAQRANQCARANIGAYAHVYSTLTGAALPIARKVVERENPALYAPDAAFVADLQRATDRFVAYGVFPQAVDVAALVETRLLTAQ